MSLLCEKEAGKLKIKIYDTRAALGSEAAKEAAEKIKELLERKKDINMIFAAAPSQNEFLEALVSDDSIDWSRINAFHMDEYIGLDNEAPQSFGKFLKDKLFARVPFKTVNYINGCAGDLEAECERYTSLLKENPPDIVCMGIGENGHIAFNDPHVAFFNDPKMVKIVELDERCRQQQVNDGCFTGIDKVPAHALTLTIPALTAGKYIFCMVPGKTKTEAVYNTVKGPVSEKCPASILKTHDRAVLYVDADSAAMLLEE